MSEIDDAARKVEGVLATFRAQGGPSVDQWLQILYENYHRRFLQDNMSVWGNGKVIVPFSLSAFAVFASIDCPSFLQIAVLGAASSGLLLLWLVNAENHRAFQNKSVAWMIAIERIIGVDSPIGPKVPDGRMNRLLSGSAMGRRIIRWLCIGVPVVWVALLVLRCIV